jgi:hypothetical protein
MKKIVVLGLFGSMVSIVSAAYLIPYTILPGAVGLHSRMGFGESVEAPPLNTSVLLTRKISRELNENSTAQLLSLVMENDNTNYPLFPWPFYIQLTTNHDEGDAVGSYVRLITSGTGWSAGHHSEVIQSGSGTNIGMNVEMSKPSGAGRTIGLNLQAEQGYGDVKAAFWGDEAINIQTDADSGWDTGIKFNAARMNTGIEFSDQSKGNRGIWLKGRFAVGIDLANNNLRINQGAKLELEETGQITISFNQRLQRIEFKNDSAVLGYIDTVKATRKRMN